MFKFLLIFILLNWNYSILAQYDSISRIERIRPYIAPSLLITSGLYINTTSSKYSKGKLQQQILNKYPNVSTHVDDYLPFIPIGQMYLGKRMGLKSKNNYFNQSKNLFLSQLFTSIITHSLKRSTKILRPDGTPHAFPSGHTSMAFSSASTLFYEYKTYHPVYASSGFLSAGATGALRVLNNRHWVSDVLVGAGIAIIVTHLIYHFEPLKNWTPFKRKRTTTAQLLFY